MNNHSINNYMDELGGGDCCDGSHFDDATISTSTGSSSNSSRRRNQSRRRQRRRPDNEETTNQHNREEPRNNEFLFWYRASCSSALLLVPLAAAALIFLSSSSGSSSSSSSSNKFQPNFRRQQHQQYNHHHHHPTDHGDRFLLLEQSRGPAVGTTHSYSTYVGYHKRTAHNSKTETDSYYAFPTDDADLAMAAAVTEQSLTSKGSSSIATKWQENSRPAVALTASSAAAAAKQHVQYRLTRDETDLVDVGFCLALALVWTVWMLRSFLKSDLLRYSQDSITVRGHVLQVTMQEETSLGTGIPTYKAVIDYMVTTTSTAGGAGPGAVGGVGDDTEASSSHKIQIRKQFETQTHLEQGFANVELLVLQNEPTHSVLKEDWEAQVEEMEAEQRQEAGRGIFSGCCCSSKWWKRLWIACCIVIILMSLLASVVAVHRLPHEQRSTGWICVCAGIALLLPTAVLIRMLLTAVQRSLQQGSEAAGVIVQGGATGLKNYSCDALENIFTSACDDDEKNKAISAVAVAASTTPGGGGNAATGGGQQLNTISNSIVQHHQTPDVDETGCYVIRTPFAQRFRSDVSDISAVSQTALNTTTTATAAPTLPHLGTIMSMGINYSGIVGAGVAVGGGGSSIDGVAGVVDGGGAVIGVSGAVAAATDQFPRPRLF
jgi:hypothetical protein